MKNGTYLADFCCESAPFLRDYKKCGALLYFRSHHAKVRLDRPVPERGVIGRFRESEKVPEAVMIEGDLYEKDVKVGHIHSQQNGIGETLYWIRVTKQPSKFPVWLRVKLEDE